MYRVLIRLPNSGAIRTRKYYETQASYERGLARQIQMKGSYYRIQGHQLVNLESMQWFTLTDRPPGPTNAG